MEFKEVVFWVTDNKKETTKAVVVVSSCGTVKRLSYKHWNTKNKGYSTRKEIVLTQSSNRGKQRKETYTWKGKYLHVMIRGKAYSVHRLVALAWIPNPQNKPQINHKNGIRNDNNVSNLEWCTNQENMTHAKENKLYIYPKGEKMCTSKLTDKQVIHIKQQLKNYKRGMLTELGKMFGVGNTTISEIKAGRSWGHIK